jgi:transketolase
MKLGEMIAPRDAFGDALAEAGAKYERLVVLDADVGRSTQTYRFQKKYPERFYQIGIAEQNMMGIAAGLAATGWLPFVSTFAVFAAKRASDQVRVSIAYPRLNVKINGGYGGIPTGKAGATHSSVEDLAVMRAMPNMTVLTTADAVEVRKAVFAALEYDGPVYLRTVRDPVPVIFDESYRFEIGKACTLREGTDLSIISTGMMTAKVLQASDILRATGISARVIHVPTLKPMDEGAIIKASKETGRIITVENHNIIGGLGSAVAEVLATRAPCHLRRLGIKDHFVESGDNEAVFTKYGMNTEDIVACAKEFLSQPGKRGDA